MLIVVAASAAPTAVTGAVLAGGDFTEAFFIGLGICSSFAATAFYLPIANYFSLSLGRTGPLAQASFIGAASNLAINIALVASIGVWSGLISNFVGYWCMYLVLARKRAREPALRRQTGA